MYGVHAAGFLQQCTPPKQIVNLILTSYLMPLACVLNQRVVLVEYCKDTLASFQPVCRADGTKVSGSERCLGIIALG